jgi:hypothetical protein
MLGDLIVAYDGSALVITSIAHAHDSISPYLVLELRTKDGVVPV